MPVEQCKNGKWRIGHGACVFDTKAKAVKVYQAILASGNMTAPIISFDFDGVLDTPKGFDLAKKKIEEGNKVIIITARMSTQHKEVEQVADMLGIKRTDIHYTNHKNKWEFVKKLNVSVHYDNNADQIEQINRMTKSHGVLI